MKRGVISQAEYERVLAQRDTANAECAELRARIESLEQRRTKIRARLEALRRSRWKFLTVRRNPKTGECLGINPRHVACWTDALPLAPDVLGSGRSEAAELAALERAAQRGTPSYFSADTLARVFAVLRRTEAELASRPKDPL